MSKARFYVKKLKSNYWGIYRGKCQVAFAKSKVNAYIRVKELKDGKGERLW